MPRPDLSSFKDTFLDFIDLLIKCRQLSRGKKGLTTIYKREVEALGIDRYELAEFLNTLAGDDVIEQLDEAVLTTLLQSDEFTVFSKLTALEIRQYKKSYSSEDATALIPAPSWGSVTIKFINNESVSVSVRGTETIDRTATPRDFGLTIKKAGPDFGKPNFAWGFLQTLASGSGVFSIPRGTTRQQMNNLKKRKEELKKSLQATFGLNDDPFYDFSEGQYRLKLTITRLVPNTQPTVSDTQEQTPFEEVIEDINYLGEFTEDTERQNRFRNQAE